MSGTTPEPPDFKSRVGNPSHDLSKESLHSGQTEKIVARVAQELGQPNLVEALSSLPPSDLSSLMLEVYDRLSKTRTPADILRAYTDNPLTNIADADPREILAVDQLFFDSIPTHFKPVELSILNPLGSNSVISGVSQKTAFTATRQVEVMADITIGLALEASLRRRETLHDDNMRDTPVFLASAQRIARLRQRPSQPGFNSHWKVVALASAGKNTKGEGRDFEAQAFLEHARTYLELFKVAPRVARVRVAFSDVSLFQQVLHERGIDRKATLHAANHGNPTNFIDHGINLPLRASTIDGPLCEQMKSAGFEPQARRLHSLNWVVTQLRTEFPKVEFDFCLNRLAGAGYYRNLCFHLEAENLASETFVMADAGNPAWTQRLLQSKQETIVISGMGSELFVRKFGAPPRAPR